MDFAKLGSNNWSGPGKQQEITATASQSVANFIHDLNHHAVPTTMNGVIHAAKTMRVPSDNTSSQRKNRDVLLSATTPVALFPSLRARTSNLSTTAINSPINGTYGYATYFGDTAGSMNYTMKKKSSSNPLRKTPHVMSYSVTERPANRVEIDSLDRELEDRVKSVLFCEIADLNALDTGDLYQPHKDAILLIRDHMLQDFNVTLQELPHEQWLDRLIKCESLRDVCDHVASVLNDMLSVTSSELGSVLRKLRYTYKQSFEQMNVSTRQLFGGYMDSREALDRCVDELSAAKNELAQKEEGTLRLVAQELLKVTTVYENQQALDKETISQTEYQMEQMSETLRSLNGIFKAMQSDGSASRTSDLLSRCQRLEKENRDLGVRSKTLDKCEAALAVSEARVTLLETERFETNAKLEDLEREMRRRESVVAMLMEKDAMRTAELEKMKRIEDLTRESEVVDVSALGDSPPTSVLCIKCKRSLDDLSNIRAAVYGDPSGRDGKKKCEVFRSLLPNLRGRRPSKNNEWIRTCMRSIMLCKMREDVALLQIKGEISRFPHFVYAWFEKPLDLGIKGAHRLSGADLSAAHGLADEERWGLYYGVKALSKNDPEAQVFWGLLDESYGEDGQQFVFHCLSFALSMSGSSLWSQLGSPLFKVNGISMMNDVMEQVGYLQHSSKPYVWLDIITCTKIVKIVLVRALKTQLRDALDALDALKVSPEVQDPFEEEGGDASSPQEKKIAAKLGISSSTRRYVTTNRPPEATHINLFMWLRVMLQQLQGEQIHRAAAAGLMFESAAIGALTHQHYQGDKKDGLGVGPDLQTGSSSLSVEYPQFQAICRTLFPTIATIEVASLFSLCYEQGRKKVTVEVFLNMANQCGFFSRSLRLSTLPLMEQHTPMPPASDMDSPTRTNGITRSISMGAFETLSAQSRETLRVKLGSLIHRKLAAITPDIKHLMESLPDKWRALLQEAFTATHTALNESFTQIRAAASSSHATQSASTSTSTSGRNSGTPSKGADLDVYIDGLQPYVLYRRLLSLALLVRSMIDNPLVPSEIFSSPNRQYLPSMDISLKHAEKLLSNLEEGVTISISSLLSPNTIALIRHKVRVPFELTRQKLSARKIQIFFRNFFNANKLFLPRCMRSCMLPGYLRGEKLVRFRQVIHDPYWAQSGVAEIYAFKIKYDMKACKLGLPPISLAQAVSGFHFMRWGSVYVAERAIHDLFYSVQVYSQSISRLRLFAAFFGVGDFDERDRACGAILTSTHAISKYLDLLHEVHREVAGVKDKSCHEQASEREGVKTKSKNKTASIRSEMEGLGLLSVAGKIIGGDIDKGMERAGTIYGLEVTGSSKESIEHVEDEFFLPSGLIHIDTLFPSSDNPFSRLDKKDTWILDKNILKRAIHRWALSLKAQHGADSYEENSMGKFFKELPELMKISSKGEIDVDDFLYLAIVQWAKLTSLSVARSELKIPMAEKANPYFKAAEKEKSDRKGKKEEEVLRGELIEKKRQSFSPLLESRLGAGAGVETRIGKSILTETRTTKRELGKVAQHDESDLATVASSFSLTRNPFSSSFLNHFVESSYKPLDTPFATDGPPMASSSTHPDISDNTSQAVKYLDMIMATGWRSGTAVTRFQALQCMMKDNVLWDLNTADSSQRPSFKSSDGPDRLSFSTKSGDSRKDRFDTAPAHRLFTATGLGSAVAPLLSLGSAREAFIAYRQGALDLISNIQNKRIKGARNIAERAANMNEGGEPEAEEEDDMFLHFNTVLPSPETMRLIEEIERIIGDFDIKLAWLTDICSYPYPADLKKAESGKDEDESHRRDLESRDCWSRIRSLICSMSELAILHSEELPTDEWTSGTAVQIHKAGVYYIPLQSKIV